MKRNIIISFIFTLLLLPSITFSQAQQKNQKKGKQVEQLDRSIRPKPGPAPEIKIGKYESFTLANGLKVFVVENHKIPRVSYSLIIDYTPVNEGENAGVADMTGDMLRTGTTHLTKDQLDEEVDFIGASLYTTSRGFYASGLKKHNDKLLQLASDVLLNPSFDTTELEKVRTRYLSALESEKTEPSSISDRISKRLNFGKDHPYGEFMTEKSIKSLDVDKCKSYYSKFYRPELGYLAVVGDITVDEAKAAIEKYFSGWKSTNLKKEPLPFPTQPTSTVVAVVDRPEAVQTTLSVSYPVNLQPGTQDVIKASVANTILGGGVFRLFNNLREKHAYTYGAYSRLSSDQYVGNFEASTEIRNSVTDSALNQILYEMKRIREELVPLDELTLVKNYIAGNFSLSLENPQTVANFAINTARYNLPADYYANYLKNLAAVTSEDVKEMANKYILPSSNYILAVGKVSEIGPKLQPFANNNPIKYFDFDGNEYDPNKKLKEAPAGMSGIDVNNAYINAIGGEKALMKIKDLTMNATTEMQGMTIGFDIYKKAPNKYMMKVGAGDMVFQQMIFDGTNAMLNSPMGGQSKKVEGDELESMKYEAMMMPELRYNELGVKLNLDGIETINDADAYKVTLTRPDGKQMVRYFDTKTNLLVKEVTDQGNVEYSDYRVVDNVKFPFKIKQLMGGQSIDMNVLTIKINSKLKDDLFIIK